MSIYVSQFLWIMVSICICVMKFNISGGVTVTLGESLWVPEQQRTFDCLCVQYRMMCLSVLYAGLCLHCGHRQ